MLTKQKNNRIQIKLEKIIEAEKSCGKNVSFIDKLIWRNDLKRKEKNRLKIEKNRAYWEGIKQANL